MAQRRVIIEHEDGRTFSVTPQVARERYAAEGFAVVRWEDGEPYEPHHSLKPENAAPGEFDNPLTAAVKADEEAEAARLAAVEPAVAVEPATEA